MDIHHGLHLNGLRLIDPLMGILMDSTYGNGEASKRLNEQPRYADLPKPVHKNLVDFFVTLIQMDGQLHKDDSK